MSGKTGRVKSQTNTDERKRNKNRNRHRKGKDSGASGVMADGTELSGRTPAEDKLRIERREGGKHPRVWSCSRRQAPLRRRLDEQGRSIINSWSGEVTA